MTSRDIRICMRVELYDLTMCKEDELIMSFIRKRNYPNVAHVVCDCVFVTSLYSQI